ncbi:MAG: beta-ketoacyl-[acyl-carrier-protein] synthase family protein [Verrucomicrobia bacterium]|nr:beta-ketoacyl-[acyl-carrier-protein] synthase family protein [Verrucomicrobiota bacterium]
MTHDLPQRRVVITGLGVVAPNGCNLEAFWNSICRGQSAAAPLTRFDTTPFPTKIGCEVRDLNTADYIEPRKARRFALATRFGLCASVMAMRDAGIDLKDCNPDRAGIVEGTSIEGMDSSYQTQLTLLQKGYKSISPFALINAYCGGVSAEIALELGIKGHAVNLSTGSASGNDAIGLALDMIARDDADVVLAGGAETPILAPLWGAFCLTKVMTTSNDVPSRAMRPFDQHRNGFLLGEGAAFLVLEELGHALGRGARIYAELAGHGRSCEAHHSVTPHPDGVGVSRAIEKALRRARMDATQIQYVNAHGTATPANDEAETAGIKTAFGPHAGRLAVSSTKPVTGHLLGASGAVESVVTTLALHRQLIPPTLNLATPLAGCDLDYVPGAARPYPLTAAANLNSGFGGKNSCLIFREYRRA